MIINNLLSGLNLICSIILVLIALFTKNEWMKQKIFESKERLYNSCNELLNLIKIHSYIDPSVSKYSEQNNPNIYKDIISSNDLRQQEVNRIDIEITEKIRQVEGNFKNLQFLVTSSKKYHNSNLSKEIDNIKVQKDKLCNIAQLTQNLVSVKFEFYADTTNQDSRKKLDDELEKIQKRIKEFEKNNKYQE